MRPCGEIRAALRKAAKMLLDTVKAVTYRDLAAAACVGYTAARQVIKEMVRAGELVPDGNKQVPGTKRPLNLYTFPSSKQAGQDLAAALLAWSPSP